MKILLCTPNPDLETALLQEGHHVLRLPIPRGPIAAWQTRRTAAAFTPDALIANPDDPRAATLATQLAIRLIPPPPDTDYLLDTGLPAPFFPTTTLPTEDATAARACFEVRHITARENLRKALKG